MSRSGTTPYIPSVRIVLPIVQISVDPFRTHVSDGAHQGVTWVHGLHQDSQDLEVGDLDLVPRIEQEIRELALVCDVHTFQGALIHVLQQDLDFTIVVEHVMAFDHVGVVHVAEDLDFGVDLAVD
uniref:Uncharacterized protein n=1 Tax=Quercus lobata TaxID=97700 RepID=A0A7N2N041_QUELO